MNIKWITLQVADLETSRKFYGQFLGLKEQRMFSPTPGKTICFFDTENDVQVELICDISVKEITSSSSVTIGLGVNDYDEMYQKSKEQGIVFSGPVVMGGNVSCFFITDPDGTKLQIIKK